MNIPTIRVEVETDAMKLALVKALMDHNDEIERMVSVSIDAALTEDSIQGIIDRKVVAMVESAITNIIAVNVQKLMSSELRELISTAVSQRVKKMEMEA